MPPVSSNPQSHQPPNPNNPAIADTHLYRAATAIGNLPLLYEILNISGFCLYSDI
jgi:hypothetical protein